jgi:F420-dependent oxidoreductase-like protein
MRPVHFGVSLPQISRTWEETKSAALEFEGLGYDSVWLNDHLLGVPRPEIPILEAWSTLTATGAVTERVELGTLVSPPGFRNPAMLAKMAATIDQVTGGRVIVGMGAGWYEAEYRNFGYAFPPIKERMGQLGEALAITRGLFTQPEFSYQGKHFGVENLTITPPFTRQPHPPILVGGGGEKVLLRLAAQYADIWNNLASNQSHLARKIDVLKEHCAAVGRDFSEIRLSQQTLVLLAKDDAEAGPMIERAQKLFGGHMGDVTGPLAIAGTASRVKDQIRAHMDLGVDFFMMEFFGRDTREPARLFAETVLPDFR